MCILPEKWWNSKECWSRALLGNRHGWSVRTPGPVSQRRTGSLRLQKPCGCRWNGSSRPEHARHRLNRPVLDLSKPPNKKSAGKELSSPPQGPGVEDLRGRVPCRVATQTSWEDSCSQNQETCPTSTRLIANEITAGQRTWVEMSQPSANPTSPGSKGPHPNPAPHSF